MSERGGDSAWRDSLSGVIRSRTPGERDEMIRKLKENPPPAVPRPDARALPKPASIAADVLFKPVFRFIERSNISVERKTSETHAPVSRYTIWLVGLDEHTAAVFAHQPNVVVEIEGKRYVMCDAPHWRNVQHGWRVGLVPADEP